MRLGRFTMRHRTLGGLLHRLVHRRGDMTACVVCRGVWAVLEAHPAFQGTMQRAKADIEAGRWYHFDTKTGESTRNPDWPEDAA